MSTQEFKKIKSAITFKTITANASMKIDELEISELIENWPEQNHLGVAQIRANGTYVPAPN